MPVYYMLVYNEKMYQNGFKFPEQKEYDEYIESFSIVKDNSRAWRCDFESRLYSEDIFSLIIPKLYEIDKIRVRKAMPHLNI